MSRESQMQEFLARQPRLTWRRVIMRWFMRLAMYLIASTRVVGLENVPKEGAVILMMNHITAVDPGVVIAALKHRVVVPLSKVEAAKSKVLGPFVWWYGAVTVNRGEVDLKAINLILELLKAGHCVLIAPEGTRHPEGLHKPKEGFVYVATKSDAVIVPVTVSDAVGWNKRVKAFKRAKITITFGQPFKFDTRGRARIPRDEMQQMTQEAMYRLAVTLPDPSLRGEYSDIENATTETVVLIDPRTGQPLPQAVSQA